MYGKEMKNGKLVKDAPMKDMKRSPVGSYPENGTMYASKEQSAPNRFKYNNKSRPDSTIRKIDERSDSY